MRVFHPGADRVIDDEIVEGLEDPRYVARFGEDFGACAARDRADPGASEPFDRDAFLAGKQTPVLFGSAINNFGVARNARCISGISHRTRTPARPLQRLVEPDERSSPALSSRSRRTWIRHRDRIAFVRVCSDTSGARHAA